MAGKNNGKSSFSEVYNSNVGRAVLAVIEKPKTVTEIARDVGERLSKDRVKISSHIKGLENAGIVECLTSKIKKNKPGQMYGLTDKGIRYKKRICKEDKVKPYKLSRS